MWNKDEAKGKGKEVKGDVKRTVGKWTGNRELEEEGETERTAGKVQKNVGKVRRKAGEALEDVGRAIKR